jgi:hypothetical protein
MPSHLMLSPQVVATPHPHSTILSDYLKDEVAGGERALAEIYVYVVWQSYELAVVTRTRPNPTGVMKVARATLIDINLMEPTPYSNLFKFKLEHTINKNQIMLYVSTSSNPK